MPSHDRLTEEAAAALPPPRDDEPASLRQDILDELGDHLACAFRRELLRTNGDDQRAEANVRRRFGDPARIARRLWFDAMRSRLMLQKVLIGTCAVLVATCVLFGFLLWQAVGDVRDANVMLLTRSQETSAALLAQSQAANAALLEQLRKLEQASAIDDPQWNPVTIRLVTGSKDGPPAEGFTVELVTVDRSAGPFLVTSGPDGIADCGLMEPANYAFKIHSPWGEQGEGNITVRPGQPLDQTIVCPAAPPATVPIDWQIDWPENLKDLESRDDVWLLALIEGELWRDVGDHTWRLYGGDRLLAFHPDGRTINLTTVETTTAAGDLIRRSQSIQQFIRGRDDDNPLVINNLAWAGGNYTIDELGLATWDGQGSPIELLGDTYQPAIAYMSNPFHTGSLGGTASGTIAKVLAIGRPHPSYTAPSSGSASWTIDVPPGLITWADMRKRLAKDGDAAFVNLYRSELFDLFPAEGDPIPSDEREPIEAELPAN